MRQPGVNIERRFVHPFGMNSEDEGFAQGLECLDADASGLGSRGLENTQQFFAKRRFRPRRRLKANHKVHRQVDTSRLRA